MTEAFIHTAGADICTEAFGDPARPALLLIMGAYASMLWWPEGLCRRLAESGRFVIRYDHRDTGRSTTYPPGRPGYSLDDLAADAIAILDAYKIDQAHLVGMSLGGMIAQIIALQYPDRVLTVSLLSTSIFGPPNPNLPQIDPLILAYHAQAATLDWSDSSAVTPYMLGGWRLLSGSAHPFDEPAIRTIAAAEMARAGNLLSMFNHALLKGGEHWHGRINQIKSPTLVIHGSDDPVLPYPHGQALANEIPGARLLTLHGTGHELHQADWPAIVEAIIRHTS